MSSHTPHYVTAREWRRLGPSPSHAEKPPKENETKHQKMTGDNDSNGEGDMQEQTVDIGTNGRRTPRNQQGSRNMLRAARGDDQSWHTAAKADTRRSAQRRAAEAGRWRVGKNSRWEMIHAGRGCGEWVRKSGEATLKATDGRGGRTRRNSTIQKTTDTGGADRVKLLTISVRVLTIDCYLTEAWNSTTS